MVKQFDLIHYATFICGATSAIALFSFITVIAASKNLLEG